MCQVLFARQGNSRWGHFDSLTVQVFIQGSIVDYGTIFNPEDDNTNIKAFLKGQVF